MKSQNTEELTQIKTDIGTNRKEQVIKIKLDGIISGQLGEVPWVLISGGIEPCWKSPRQTWDIITVFTFAPFIIHNFSSERYRRKHVQEASEDEEQQTETSEG